MTQERDANADGTIMLYMYRDASNYKAWGLARFPGEYSRDHVERFLSLLDEDGCFDVDATTYIQHPGVVMSATASDDHPLVEVTSECIWSALNAPASVSEWADVDFVVDVPFARFVDEYSRSIATGKCPRLRSWVDW